MTLDKFHICDSEQHSWKVCWAAPSTGQTQICISFSPRLIYLTLGVKGTLHLPNL